MSQQHPLKNPETVECEACGKGPLLEESSYEFHGAIICGDHTIESREQITASIQARRRAMTSQTPGLTEENGQLVLHDPVGLAVIQSVAKYKCGSTLQMNAERVEHFRGRMRVLGRSAREVVIVLLNVDDPNGGALAEVLMPGFDWQLMRDRGEVPFARGLAGRDGIASALDSIDAEAAMKLRAASLERASVVVVDHGVAEVF